MTDYCRERIAELEAEIDRLREELRQADGMLLRVALVCPPGRVEYRLRRMADLCQDEAYIAAADLVRQHARDAGPDGEWWQDLERLRDEQARWMDDRMAAEAADIAEVA